MAKNRTIKIYCRLAKKRYLQGKYVYEHERIYVPIPSRFHKIIRPFLNQRLKIEITNKNNSLIIILHPAKTFLHAENTPRKTDRENRKTRSKQHSAQNFV